MWTFNNRAFETLKVFVLVQTEGVKLLEMWTFNNRAFETLKVFVLVQTEGVKLDI